jgi:aryl sulfotransferase
MREPTQVFVDWETDSSRWAHFKPRGDDIVIATPPKCGTTWMQQIVGSLIFQSTNPIQHGRISPWIDNRGRAVEDLMAFIDAQEHRRFLKSHLALDAMPLHDEVKYIHVGRDGRDCALSWHNHQTGFKPEILAMFDQVGLADPRIARPHPRPAQDPADFFHDWLEGDPEKFNGYPARIYFGIERSFWNARKRPNVLLVHYADLKADLDGEMRGVATFLDIETPDALWPRLVEAARFETMQANSSVTMPRADRAFDGGSLRFFNKGVNGRWQGVYRDEDLAAYEARVKTETTPTLARWLERGRLGAGDPETSAD